MIEIQQSIGVTMALDFVRHATCTKGTNSHDTVSYQRVMINPLFECLIHPLDCMRSFHTDRK